MKGEIEIDFNHFLQDIVKVAKSKKASDIHFLNEKENCLVKLRIDDQLILYQEIKKDFYERLILYIKFKSHMNLNISKSPQSSALNMIIDDELIRIRVSTLPSYDGESIVLRVSLHHYDEKIENLLLFKERASVFTDCFHESNGLMLITGPTCSGKTTLTYSLLNGLQKKGLSIVTIEDPVEQYRQGFVQLQVNENAGISYDSGVKEILRHDPDIIFIGEIRDAYTAKSALRASLTGHIVISTMHATNALKALYRLLEFGLSIFDLEQTMLLVSNQRLVIHKGIKRIVFEALRQKEIIEALQAIKSGKRFTYHTIEDALMLLDHAKVMKK